MRPFLIVVALILCCWPTIGNAATYNFSWTGNPALDSTIVSSDDATLAATGTIVINASPGSSFTLSDITSVNIDVTGTSITAFNFASWASAGGTISANGLSATFNAAGNPFFENSTDTLFFGCEDGGCGTGFTDFNVLVTSGSVNDDVLYASAADALASMHMTAATTATPLPAALPLFASGLGALGLLGWRRKRKAQVL